MQESMSVIATWAALHAEDASLYTDRLKLFVPKFKVGLRAAIVMWQAAMSDCFRESRQLVA